LQSPGISTAAKKKALTATFSGKVQQPVLSMCLILAEKRRMQFIPEIFAAYRKVLDGILGRTYVDIAVARDFTDGRAGANGGIDDELKALIIKKVDTNRAAFGLEARKTLQYDVSVKVNPGLLAGVRVRVADYIYDGTVARDLIHWHDVAAVHPIDAQKAFVD
jgi:F-type H+-transporting ATPase subunit delta